VPLRAGRAGPAARFSFGASCLRLASSAPLPGMRPHMRSSLAPSPLLVCLCSQLLSSTLSAAPPGADAGEPVRNAPPAAPGEYPVNFSAGRVEVDMRLSELELADDVVVVVDRYRLTANH